MNNEKKSTLTPIRISAPASVKNPKQAGTDAKKKLSINSSEKTPSTPKKGAIIMCL